MNTGTLFVVQDTHQHLATLAREAGLEVALTLSFDRLEDLDGSLQPPDVLLLDLRGHMEVPAAVAALRRRYPRMGVVVVAAALDPALMLQAMRAGVGEYLHEPIEADELRAAVERTTGHQLATAAPGKVLAFVGAKGGVGTTTLAVNVAAAVAARRSNAVLLVDLHLTAHGDAALLLGVEPRFSVIDALENTSRIDATYLKSLVVRSRSGVDVLASPERPILRSPEPGQLQNMLQRLAELYPCVVLDVPRSDLGTIDALDPLTAMLLVVNQELPAVRRATEIGALLRQRYGKDRVGAVLSRYDARADIGQDDIQRVVGLPVWGTMPSDYRRAIAAAHAGRPLIADNHSRLAAAMTQLAERLVKPAAGASAPRRSSGRLSFFS